MNDKGKDYGDASSPVRSRRVVVMVQRGFIDVVVCSGYQPLHVNNQASFLLHGQCGSNKDAANQKLCRCNQSSSEHAKVSSDRILIPELCFQCDTGTMYRSLFSHRPVCTGAGLQHH